MASEQNALKLIERLILIDAELARGGMPGLYDHIERLFQNGNAKEAQTWSYHRTDAAWYDKSIHPLQIARLNRLIAADANGAGTDFCTALELLLRCHEDGDVMHRQMDERMLQAKRIWTASWGQCLGAKSFGDYLVSIPPVPEASSDIAERFSHLMLVDGRTSVLDACVMADISLDDEDAERVFWDPWNEAGDSVYWLRYRSEVLYRRGPTPKEYVASLREPERLLTLHEGLFMCVHDFRRRRSLPMALSGKMVDRQKSVDPDRWPLIAHEKIVSIDAREHQEVQVPTCLPPKP